MSEDDSLIIEGDNRVILPVLAGTYMFDLILTDPPYGISHGSEKPAGDSTYSAYCSSKGRWDIAPTSQWIYQADELLSPKGIIAVCGVYGSLVPVYNAMKDLGYTFLTHFIWHKSNPAPSLHRRMFTLANEIILIYAKGKGYFFDYEVSKEFNDGKQQHNVITMPAVRKVAGVTRKPPNLMDLFVRTLCPPGGFVLDPFCGSGTTVERAMVNGRVGIGIEMDPRVAEVAESLLLLKKGF